MKIIKIILYLILVLVGSICFGAEVQWPKMQEFEVGFVVQTNAEKIEFIKPLHDKCVNQQNR